MTIARTARMRQESEELKNDLSQDLGMVDTQMIKPAQDAKDSLHMLKKTIKKREDKKLDFERYQGRVDAGNKKSKPSDRDRTTLTKAQSDLQIATEAYSSADDNLRHCLPGILTSVFSLLPHILAAQISIQNTLLGHYYTSIHSYCTQEGFPNPAPPMDEVIRLWEDSFKPIQHEVESLPTLANSKIVRLPMNAKPDSNGYINGSSRRPSGHSLGQRTHSVSPARALPPSPNYDHKPPIPLSTSPGPTFMLSAQSEPLASPSPQLSAYQTPPSVAAFSPAGPNTDYFSRDRLPSTSQSQLSTSFSNSASHTHSGAHTPNPYLSSALSTTPPSASALSQSILAASKKRPPPPPPRVPSQPPAHIVTALYDFGGQGEGDLVFREGDRIRVLKSTESRDDWWVGELRGVRGSFPANYCE